MKPHIRKLCDEAYELGVSEVLNKYQWKPVSAGLPKDFGEDWVLVLVFNKLDNTPCIPTVAEYGNGHWQTHTFTSDCDIIDGPDSPFEVRYWKPIYDELHDNSN